MEDGELSVGQIEFEVLEGEPGGDRKQPISFLTEVRAKVMVLVLNFLSLFLVASFKAKVNS